MCRIDVIWQSLCSSVTPRAKNSNMIDKIEIDLIVSYLCLNSLFKGDVNKQNSNITKSRYPCVLSKNLIIFIVLSPST